MTFQVRVYGLPVAKASPRAAVIAGRTMIYTKKTDRAWKETVRQQVIEANNARGCPDPWAGPLALDLEFFLSRPMSLPKRVVFHIKKPDCDNLTKPIKDALKGLVYRDDAQVVALTVRKLYGAQPGVSIRVACLEEIPEW